MGMMTEEWNQAGFDHLLATNVIQSSVRSCQFYITLQCQTLLVLHNIVEWYSIFFLVNVVFSTVIANVTAIASRFILYYILYIEKVLTNSLPSPSTRSLFYFSLTYDVVRVFTDNSLTNEASNVYRRSESICIFKENKI